MEKGSEKFSVCYIGFRRQKTQLKEVLKTKIDNSERQKKLKTA